MSKADDLKLYLAGKDTININVVGPMIDEVVAEVDEDTDPKVVATPVADPVAGEIAVGATVALTCATPGSTIYYTVDGTAPTNLKTRYTGPITLTVARTIKAIAYEGYRSASEVLSAAYTMATVATPTANVSAGDVPVGTSVTLSCATDGSTIRYTTNGDTPTATSTLYTDPIVINTGTTVKAIGLKAAMANSAVFSVAYTVVTVLTPTATPDGGAVLANSTISLACNTAASAIYYTTNGDVPTTGSTLYAAPFAITQPMTVKAIATKSGLVTSEMLEKAFTISQVVAPVSDVPSGAITTSTNITLTSGTALAAIYYTIDGSTPGIGKTQYMAPFALAEGATLKVIAIKANMIDSAISEYVYTISQVATPQSFPLPGSVPDNTPVTLVCSTLGATVYYTTNGDIPTIASTEYTVPVTITDTMTVKAIAVKADMTNSAMMSSLYTVV